MREEISKGDVMDPHFMDVMMDVMDAMALSKGIRAVALSKGMKLWH